MIKGILKDGTIFLGLDAENIKRLKEDKPIHIAAESLKIERDIFIVYGETLDKIIEEYFTDTEKEDQK